MKNNIRDKKGKFVKGHLEVQNLIKVFVCCLQIYKWKMHLKREAILNNVNSH